MEPFSNQPVHAMSDDIEDPPRKMFKPEKFANPEWLSDYPAVVETYVRLKITGIAPDMACLEAFEMIRDGVDTGNLRALVLALETNPYVRAVFNARLAEVDQNDIWHSNGKHALQALASIVRDQSGRYKGAQVIQAIDRLNLLAGVKVADPSSTEARTMAEALADQILGRK